MNCPAKMPTMMYQGICRAAAGRMNEICCITYIAYEGAYGFLRGPSSSAFGRLGPVFAEGDSTSAMMSEGVLGRGRAAWSFIPFERRACEYE